MGEPGAKDCVIARMDILRTVGDSSWAYLDGGTGSLILQSALAGVLTAGFVVKSRWHALKAMIAGRKLASK